jgi:hypothetical protein
MTAPAVPEGMKRCTKCGEVKSVSEFCRMSHTKDGLQSMCKVCCNERYRKYYEQNREKVNERVRKYRERNRDKDAERHRKYNACVKRPSCPLVGHRGADLIIFTCEMCGVEFRRLKSAVDCDYQRRGTIPRFCSKVCKNEARRNGYKSPYAKKIEEIKKRLKN